jgi:hypothetical protein
MLGRAWQAAAALAARGRGKAEQLRLRGESLCRWPLHGGAGEGPDETAVTTVGPLALGHQEDLAWQDVTEDFKYDVVDSEGRRVRVWSRGRPLVDFDPGDS